MADEQNEELNEGQALEAMQRLMVEYRAIAKIHGVLSRYDQAKLALPDLESRAAEKTAELAKINQAVVDAQAKHDSAVARMTDESQRRTAEAEQHLQAVVTRLEDQIAEVEAQKTAKMKEVESAVAAAQSKLAEIEAKVQSAQEAAEREVSVIEQRKMDKQAEFDRLVKDYNDFKAEHGLLAE